MSRTEAGLEKRLEKRITPSCVNEVIRSRVTKLLEGVARRNGSEDATVSVWYVAAGRFVEPPFEEVSLRRVMQSVAQHLAAPRADRGVAEVQSTCLGSFKHFLRQ